MSVIYRAFEKKKKKKKIDTIFRLKFERNYSSSIAYRYIRAQWNENAWKMEKFLKISPFTGNFETRIPFNEMKPYICIKWG